MQLFLFLTNGIDIFTVLRMRLRALLFLALVAVVSALSIEPESLRTEGAKTPLGIHATNPLLSWRLQSDRRGDNQTSYQLQAASSSDGFDAPDLWDTGKLSDRQAFASWNGSTLSSRDQVYWRVRAWDADDVASSWSEPSTFELGLLEESDWTAQWIENNEFATGVNSLPLFASEFKVNCTVAKARLYITGLGVFYAELNGKSVSDEVLGPGYSTINRTVLYRAYDVTDLLTEGDNVIGVSIGKGIYNSDKPLLNRYCQVNTTWVPQLTDMVGYVIRATNDEVGIVQTSNSFLNKLYEITDRSMKSNMYSVLTDCPHREKLGWLEQDHLLFDLLARRFDLQAYGYNLMHTIADAQAQYGANSAGLIPTTAPEYDVFPDKFRDDPNWGSAIMRVAMHLYRYYGDTRVLSENYDIMVAYMDYLGRRATDSVIEGVGLSDWGAGDGKTPTVPIGLTNTFGYHQAATAMKQIALWLSNSEEAQEWEELANSIGEAFHNKWFIDDTTGTTSQAYYSGNIQASNALALDLGVVPEEYQDLVFESLLTLIENTTFYPTVGEIAFPSLLRVLEGRGRSDVIFKMLTAPGLSSSGLASYSYSIELGATSLWEFLNGGRGSSYNHFMMGAPSIWIQRLSGLGTAADAVRWNLINYEPIMEANLTSASSSYLTPTGQAGAAWELSNNVLTYDIVVPVGSVGVVSLNATQVQEGGQDVSVEQEGVLAVEFDQVAKANWKIRVGSGSYQFSSVLL
ncbi:hypothetical protein K4K60_012685 [Colletotrichum sp. SAR11_57]|nr:hypothetical protein K4K60_012685 [Colletotrichum sp. SAR11_57]